MTITSAVHSLIEAFTSHIRQTDRLLRLTTVATSESVLGSVAGQGLTPERVHIEEAISGLASDRIQLTALSLDAQLDLDALMGTPVLLELLTAASRAELRPFHGHITRAERVGSNGGLARYAFTITPWTSFLGHRRDSHLWIDKTVVEIVEDLLSDYQGQASLNPIIRWELADATLYPKRSLTVQFEESDLHFLQRLLAEEGLSTYFEHQGNAASLSLGSHTLVIADHNQAYLPGLQPSIRFHRAHATEADDTIQQFSPQARWTPTAIQLASWDYKTLGQRPVSAVADLKGRGNAITHASTLTQRSQQGHYGYANSQQGERRAQNQLQALAQQASQIKGQGVARSLAPGSRFALEAHSQFGLADAIKAAVGHFGAGSASDAGKDNQFIVLSVSHRASNNFKADLGKGVESLLGTSKLGMAVARPFPLPLGEGKVRASQSPTSSQEEPLYSNHFTVLPAATPVRPTEHPEQKPRITAAQTAVVVGPAGSVIHTDRDHRIQVQFHWQRGAASHSRRAHPAGHDNAPGSNSQSVWLRVKTDVAGSNWGSNHLPRVGQEVLVHFLDGDPDRPIVTGSVYNGQGQTDAQGNQIASGGGSSTGNAPAWFAGESGGHAHAAVINGIQTQELPASQTGGGGHNHLIFDASEDQARITLATTQHQTSLTLGHLKQQQGNARKADRGHGFELNTQASGAIRAGQGLLLSTEASQGQSSPQLHAPQLTATLEAAQALTEALAQTAAKHLPKTKEPSPTGRGQGEGLSEPSTPANTEQKKPVASGLPSSQAQADLLHSLSQTRQGQPSPVAGGGEGSATAWSAAHLIAHGQAALVTLTPANLHQSAGLTLSQIAGADLNRLAQGSQTASAKDGLALFTHGQLAKGADGKAAQRVIQDTGLKLHAASGPVSLQAQSAALNLNAQKAVNLSSTHGGINASAKQKLTLTAKGAAIVIEGSNITLTAPGAVKLHGAKKILTSGASAKSEKVTMKKAGKLSEQKSYNEAFQLTHKVTGEPLAGLHYRIESSDGQVFEGVTNAKGYTRRVRTDNKSTLSLHLLDD